MCACRPLTLAVVKDLALLVSVFSFLSDLDVERLEVDLGESIVGEEPLDFVLNELGHGGVVSVLEFELVDKHSFKLLALLDLDEALSPALAHLGCLASRPV